MLFVKSDELKVGMRLARPIYNRNGVLLYERNSKLTQQGIVSIQNFQLIGIFVLEPAEPVPPMTQDDIIFERFQTMEVFAIREELEHILKTKEPLKMQSIATDIIRNYGRAEKRINFVQNLRSKEDFVYKHSLNVAILCALISHMLGLKLEDQLNLVTTALVHEIGSVQKEFKESTPAILEQAYWDNGMIRTLCMQADELLESAKEGKADYNQFSLLVRVLTVAEIYDQMTAMKEVENPASEVEAIRCLLGNKKVFDRQVVEALIRSIFILGPGTCIELNTGEKGLVLERNEGDVLRPIILSFSQNKIFDLSDDKVFRRYQIKDIMKTMDNRHIIDKDLLEEYGYNKSINFPKEFPEGYKRKHS